MLHASVERPDEPPASLFAQARHAVIWRSGAQIVGQLITWGATFLVIRILDPDDYGLFAMTQVMLSLLNMLNGTGLAKGLIQQPEADERSIRQLYGMLIVLNFSLGATQFLLAPVAAAYFRQPIVADLLRVQSFLYFTTPFVAFPYALLARSIDFKRQAKVYLLSSVAGGVTALAGALAGLGVWTLIAAPIALFTTRAVGMTVASGHRYRPTFDFRGAGALAKFGGLMATAQLFWLMQSQADVFIAGRVLGSATLGLYTTGLFLTQILVAKFVPAVNEVAFSIYARMQHDRAAVAEGFARSVRLVMLVALPFYIGLAVTAEPLVATVLGPKWTAAAPLVRLLAIAMPAVTLQVLFSPACDGIGRPGISLRTGMVGAALMPLSFAIGLKWGVTGLAASWIGGYSLYLLVTALWVLPVIGLPGRRLVAAIAPAARAALAMGALVLAADALLPPLAPPPRLAILVATGSLVYGAWLYLFARDTLAEAVALARGRMQAPPGAAAG
ncbi:MAG: lipopolysaccharide biosynthesis protein [Alphaproteobacteria bacterium]|nr:lipopolysaccharide biosynthesis protein [Alphaproteobacteria bacterium]MBV9372019.1 lipopolysaccharide biosynthesis protein [Alphaproteobacteria bacterium]MBV9901707.1 lipopolysaccharide biosynthesis protein [Alphaproteobacteria bacterium]